MTMEPFPQPTVPEGVGGAAVQQAAALPEVEAMQGQEATPPEQGGALPVQVVQRGAVEQQAAAATAERQGSTTTLARSRRASW